jgi:Putative DNA-binding domain
MLSLVEFQRRIAGDILHDAPQEGVDVHRGTILGALVNALRLTFPTVVKLTGTDFFEQVATEYARDNLPRSAVLYFYGDGFPDFLRDSNGARALPYLWDVARFDLRIDRAGHAALALQTQAIPIDPQLEVRLASSLTCLQVNYPVDLLRDALDAGCPEQLSDLDMTPRARHFAIWRGPDGAAVKPIGPAAAAFLNTLLKSGTAKDALQHATEFTCATDALAEIQTDILGASFTRLTWSTA